MKQQFDVGVGSSAAAGVIELDIMCQQPLQSFFMQPDGSYVYCFPLDLEEAKLARDMLSDAIEHVEADGHG